ncbi:pyridoxamine 5'-phosphate oxidase family protein [Saccharibacillus alkalitolerans]|uniref:Pyridoxamine 5'-phosphate oxidase family protein n=1 Tax=Saccharibacillus alkalitolerans TaxID=2705290 RepID=A0ABX0F511_9BACL|nr:pyridoxamine 5'-phosphate oxidase family protein [Saccharibacillus alkalitolerans]NGZ75099.1 pyridoxamine 5'-phosphate oxidase family protein [Saccharibacillus alkalitolerans]
MDTANTASLNDDLYALLDGTRLERKTEIAMTLHTVDGEGYPHQAMVSAGEVWAESRGRLRIALWLGTNTAGNLLRDGKGLLGVVCGGVSYTVRLRAEPLPELPDARHPRARFAASVLETRADVAKYAALTSGITIELHDPGAVVARWEETLEELKR